MIETLNMLLKNSFSTGYESPWFLLHIPQKLWAIHISLISTVWNNLHPISFFIVIQTIAGKYQKKHLEKFKAQTLDPLRDRDGISEFSSLFSQMLDYWSRVNFKRSCCFKREEKFYLGEISNINFMHHKLLLTVQCTI